MYVVSLETIRKEVTMETYKPEAGDIFLCSSTRFGAKIVVFLMTAPTIYQYVWRAIRGTQEKVRYYHAGMVVSETKIAEQQWKVQYAELDKILSRDIIIYRMKHLTEDQKNLLIKKADFDIGKIYDIPQIIGKTLTWLTGIKWFTTLLGNLTSEAEICPTIIGDWFEGICSFGVEDKELLTTHIIDKYCDSHKEEWEVVYKNG